MMNEEDARRAVIGRQPDADHRLLVNSLSGVVHGVVSCLTWLELGHVRRAHARWLYAQTCAMEAQCSADDIERAEQISNTFEMLKDALKTEPAPAPDGCLESVKGVASWAQ